MAILEIRKQGDPILRKNAKPVARVDSSIIRLINDMFETMYNAPGVGLAAPQVGIPLRIVVIDISKETKDPIVLINPHILNQSGSVVSEEGCLSVPEVQNMIKRAEKVVVKGINQHGKEVQIEGVDLLARVIQHEIDHLNGILIIDRNIKQKKEPDLSQIE